MQAIPDRSEWAFRIVVIAGGLGLAGAYLLQPAPWGLGFPTWILLAIVCAFGLFRRAPVTLSRGALWMALPILAFSACFFWRDSDSLKIANLTAVIVAIGVLLVRHRKGEMHGKGLPAYTHNMAIAWLTLVNDFADLITKDLDWKGHPAIAARLTAFVRGLLLAAPMLLAFGWLLGSGDDVFGKWLSSAFSFDPGNAFGYAVVFVGSAVLVGGLLRRLLLSDRPEIQGPPPPPVIGKPKGLGSIEIGTIFGLVDAMFIAFVVVQFRYFFGGAERVAQVSGLSYADYARHGFFELASASALVLPVVLGARALLNESSAKAAEALKWLSVILISCVFVVLASAFQRMNLYVTAYGLSEMRLFTTFFMVWLTLALSWLEVTVVRGRPDRFSFGALAAGFAVILSLNVANPDALIARTNLDLGRKVDLSYLGTLSLDAAPAVASEVGRLTADQRKQLVERARANWDRRAQGLDWRSANLAAMAYVSRYRGVLGGR